MRQEIAHEIIERLCGLETAVTALTKALTKHQTHTKQALKLIREEITMAHETELAAIADIKNQVISVGQQIVASLAGLRDRITALEAQVAAGADTSDIQAALADLKTNVQATDDLVDDLPVTIPPTA